MAFALTGYSARGVEIGSVCYRKGIQQVVFEITGTSADVALDLGSASGTFWTAALADATYGTLATKALASLQRISANSMYYTAIKSQQLLVRVQVATLTTTGQMLVAAGTIAPNISFNAGDGNTLYYIVLEYELKKRTFPEIVNYNQ